MRNSNKKTVKFTQKTFGIKNAKNHDTHDSLTISQYRGHKLLAIQQQQKKTLMNGRASFVAASDWQ